MAYLQEDGYDRLTKDFELIELILFHKGSELQEGDMLSTCASCILKCESDERGQQVTVSADGRGGGQRSAVPPSAADQRIHHGAVC